jgi:hypothetical protein
MLPCVTSALPVACRLDPCHSESDFHYVVDCLGIDFQWSLVRISDKVLSSLSEVACAEVVDTVGVTLIWQAERCYMFEKYFVCMR